jgi:hypothetical protein
METTKFDVMILEKIRGLIINAMSQINLVLNSHYKLSAVKEYSTDFRIELLQENLSKARIKKSIKTKFEHVPRLKPATSFINVDCKKEYEYLIMR